MAIEKYDKKTWLDEFSNQRPDLFFPEAWTDEQRDVALEEIRPARIKTAMFSAIPMMCRGKKCPIRDRCLLYAKDQAPVGKKCPYEAAMVQTFTTALMDELNVSEDNLTEVGMIRDLVDQEIQYWRASNRLGLEDFIQDAVIGINEHTGEPILKKELHIAVDMQDRILKRKKELRNQLLATREAKAKAGQGMADMAQVVADTFHQLREADLLNKKLIKKKLGIIERDEYIEDAEIIEIDPDQEV